MLRSLLSPHTTLDHNGEECCCKTGVHCACRKYFLNPINKSLKQATFGSSGGMIASMGLVLSLIVAGYGISAAIAGGIAVTIGETVSMSGAEAISEPGNHRLHRFLTMGIASFIGCLWPILPLFAGLSVWWGVPMSLVGIGVIAKMRPEPTLAYMKDILRIFIPAVGLAMVATTYLPPWIESLQH